MDICVFDDWAEKAAVDYAENYFLYELPHFYGHTSNYNKDAIQFYNHNFVNFNPFIQFLKYKITTNIPFAVEFLRIYFNVQHKHQPGGWHTDSDDSGYITGLWMVTQTLTDNSGCFLYKETDGSINQIPFVKNRFVLFDSAIVHRGDAPTTETPRITLAFKMKRIYC